MQQRPDTQPRSASFGMFVEDFDSPTGVFVLDGAAVAPAMPPAPITADNLQAAREAAFAEGLAQGEAGAAAAQAAALQALTTSLAAHMREAHVELRQCLDATAEELLRTMLGILNTVFPSLCVRLGGAEITRFTRKVVTVLFEEPRIVVRVNPSMLADVERALVDLEPEHRAHVAIEPHDTILPGDARIAWDSALAKRDAHAAWANVNDAMAQLGLGAPSPQEELRAPVEALRVATAA